MMTLELGSLVNRHACPKGQYLPFRETFEMARRFSSLFLDSILKFIKVLTYVLQLTL